MQHNLNKLYQWSKDWQLEISTPKCHCLNIASSRRAYHLDTDYYIGTTLIPRVSSILDLGITVDTNLRMSMHINNIVRKAHSRACLILKCFVSRNVSMMCRAFSVYVRPILEYCSPVWSPHLTKDIESIESVQRRFTKRLSGLFNLSYVERLELLRLQRLDVRRLIADLIFMYKLLFGLVKIDYNSFVQFNPYTATSGHRYKLIVPNFKSDVRKFFFSVRTVNIWNDLPLDTDFTSVNSFRNYIENLDLTKYCITIH